MVGRGKVYYELTYVAPRARVSLALRQHPKDKSLRLGSALHLLQFGKLTLTRCAT